MYGYVFISQIPDYAESMFGGPGGPPAYPVAEKSDDEDAAKPVDADTGSEYEDDGSDDDSDDDYVISQFQQSADALANRVTRLVLLSTALLYMHCLLLFFFLILCY